MHCNSCNYNAIELHELQLSCSIATHCSLLIAFLFQMLIEYCFIIYFCYTNVSFKYIFNVFYCYIGKKDDYYGLIWLKKSDASVKRDVLCNSIIKIRKSKNNNRSRSCLHWRYVKLHLFHRFLLNLQSLDTPPFIIYFLDPIVLFVPHSSVLEIHEIFFFFNSIILLACSNNNSKCIWQNHSNFLKCLLFVWHKFNVCYSINWHITFENDTNTV